MVLNIVFVEYSHLIRTANWHSFAKTSLTNMDIQMGTNSNDGITEGLLSKLRKLKFVVTTFDRDFPTKQGRICSPPTVN